MDSRRPGASGTRGQGRERSVGILAALAGAWYTGGPVLRATRPCRARVEALALAHLAEGRPPFVVAGDLLLLSHVVTHADCSARGGRKVLGTMVARQTTALHEGVPPHADARVPTCAPPHRVRIIVVSSSVLLETMRLLIDIAGGWELRTLSRSAGRLGPALGFFPNLVLLVVAVYVVLALVIARFVQRPAFLVHRGPVGQEDGAAHSMRAASPLDD